MNFKKLLLFLVAPLMLAFAGCEPTPQVQTFAECSVADAEGNAVTTMAFGAEQESATFTVTATRSWTITTSLVSPADIDEWFAVAPKDFVNADNSSQSKEITVSVFANEGEARTATLSIDYGDDKPLNITISQSGKGQTALGEDIFYDNFDKVVAAKEGTYWPYMDAKYGNPTPESQSGVTYASNNITVRSNSTSNSSYSDYPGSGSNNLFFGKVENYVTINGISLAALEGNALTLTFGSEKYTQEGDSTFKNEEFSVAISADGQKWTNLDYTFAANANLSGRWNLATAQFNLKEVPATVSLRFSASVASVYRLDDVKLTTGGGGAEIDLSQGTDAPGGSTGGGTTEPEQPITPGTISAITEAGNYTVEGVTVLASYARGYLVGDSTGKILAYLGQSHTYNFAVGDVVTISGAVSSYGGLLQFGEGSTLTKTSTATVDHGTAKNYDGAAMDAYLNSIKIEYVTYTGTLNINGYYYNITVPGANTAIGSIAYPVEGLVDSALNGQNVTVTGYTVGASSGKYVNTMAISVVAAGGDPIVPEPEPEPTPGVEIPEGAVVWNIGAANQTWAAETDATLGAGFAATVDNLKVACYKRNSTTAIATAKDDHFRVYKNSALVITPLDGRKITQVIMLCTDNANYDGKITYYTFDMNVSDGTTAVANQDAKYITWSGNTDKFEAYADNGQVRIKTLAVVLDGEGSGTVTPEPDPTPDPTPGEESTITIPELYALADGALATEQVINVVVSGASQNSSYGTVYVMTPGSTAAKNGFSLYNSALEGKYKVGDMLKITLPAGTAKKENYKGMPQLSGITDANIEVVSSGNTVNNIVVTADKLLDYLGMPVTIENATVAANGVWCTASAHGSHNFTAGGTAFTVYVNKRATNFQDVAYSAATGNISGIAVTYNNNLQIAPRDAADVQAFASTGGGTTEPDPTPTPDPTPGEGETTDGTTISQDIIANTGALDGTTITWDFDEFTVSNNQHNSSTAIRTTDTDHFRAYQGSLLTFTAKGGKKFSKIVVTCSGSSYATELVNSFGASVATANGADVTITCDSAEVSAEMVKQVRFKKVAVTLN